MLGKATLIALLTIGLTACGYGYDVPESFIKVAEFGSSNNEIYLDSKSQQCYAVRWQAAPTLVDCKTFIDDSNRNIFDAVMPRTIDLTKMAEVDKESHVSKAVMSHMLTGIDLDRPTVHVMMEDDKVVGISVSIPLN
jgi:hypothetical protein